MASVASRAQATVSQTYPTDRVSLSLPTRLFTPKSPIAITTQQRQFPNIARRTNSPVPQHGKTQRASYSRREEEEKRRRIQAQRADLPAWYRRVSIIEFTENRSACSSDFDEDISELGSEDGSHRDDCDCDSDDSECECCPSQEDCESERSYEGSDADYYYELKSDREDRKRQLLQWKKKLEAERESTIAYETAKEVGAAYEALKVARKEGKRSARLPRKLDSYNIHCAELVDFQDLVSRSRMMVGFFPPSPDRLGVAEGNKRKAEKIAGEVHFYKSAVFLDSFRLPKRGNAKEIRLNCDNGKHQISIRFIGADYLKLKVSRDWFSEEIFQRRHQQSFNLWAYATTMKKKWQHGNKGARRKRPGNRYHLATLLLWEHIDFCFDDCRFR